MTAVDILNVIRKGQHYDAVTRYHYCSNNVDRM